LLEEEKAQPGDVFKKFITVAYDPALIIFSQIGDNLTDFGILISQDEWRKYKQFVLPIIQYEMATMLLQQMTVNEIQEYNHAHQFDFN
jgi:hypothetical protein